MPLVVLPDGARLAADLRGYSAAIGPVNHDLVLGHHRANVHAQELLRLLTETGASTVSSPVEAPLEEMARLVRLEWRARVDARALGRENAVLHDKLSRTEIALGEAQQRAEDEAKEGERIARAYEATLSWRLTAPLRALTRLARRLRGRSAQ